MDSTYLQKYLIILSKASVYILRYHFGKYDVRDPHPTNKKRLYNVMQFIKKMLKSMIINVCKYFFIYYFYYFLKSVNICVSIYFSYLKCINLYIEQPPGEPQFENPHLK